MYCSPLCVTQEDPLLLLQNLFLFVSVLMSGNRNKWVEITVKTPHWSVWLNILNRDLMETMELS
jgi:hypothetical protein